MILIDRSDDDLDVEYTILLPGGEEGLDVDYQGFSTFWSNPPYWRQLYEARENE